MPTTADTGHRKGIVLPLAFALVLFAGFMTLGVWQVHRLAWKEALIARVDARLAASPVPAPGPDEWAAVNRTRSEYRRVSVTGHFATVRPALVQAATRLGGGFWVMAPFDDDRGFTVLVNRGFVPDRKTGAAPPPSGKRTITGLLRITEPDGGFLQSNQPAADRWFSRDIAAIARTRGLGRTAPYFIDADAAGIDNGKVAGQPVGGLTVTRFPNSHLSYAITWFVLAAMSLAGAAWLIRERVRPTRG
ncbi:SURF1 family protein [Novosphingobium sp. ZN18A2]|uniref:SURF1 family protein n=1 Tax=Novosphingobium sp. ZN18A2 TaxID=3079861 RepID=UPI0030D261DB